jgi:hypothetical protein
MSSLSLDSMWTGEEQCDRLAGRRFSCEKISAEQDLFVLVK